MKRKASKISRGRVVRSNSAPYLDQNWHGTIPNNQLFPPTPVWHMPPPTRALPLAYMPQIHRVNYDPKIQQNSYKLQTNKLLEFDHPPPITNEDSLPPHLLFHYTDYSGMCSIVNDNYIKKSIPVNTRYGEGVYLTAVQPSVPDNVILINNWNDDGLNTLSSSKNTAKIARLQYCIVISSMALNPWLLEKIRDYKGRNIWVYRSDVSLDKVITIHRRW